MQSFSISLITVAGAEMGDKTQLLVMLLATRYKKPFLILLGVCIATILSHTMAGLMGKWLGNSLHEFVLHIILAISYLIAFIWLLLPEQPEHENTYFSSSNVLLTTIIAFFVAELGDKTQIVTAILAAQFNTILPIILGTTIGMLLANVPAVFFGHHVTRYVPIKLIKIISASLFLMLGIFELIKL